MRGLQRFCRGVYDVWVNLQVELHGSYSVSRMKFLSEYSSSTSVCRASIFVIMGPFPCLIILTLIDCVPLAPTEEGSRANYLFWGRNYLTISLMTRAILEQLHLTVPSLDFTFIRTICISALPSAGAVALVLTFIYPAYLYGFRSVSSTVQTIYVLLLPIIKIATKNWISFFLGTKDDLKPQAVILNIEVFNALYVASSMQNATSITMFQLPNRVFYPQIRELDRNTLAQMIGNIAIYGIMELLSFIAMSVLLRRKLGITTLHQLAFVLDRERRMVQSNLFLLICYTIQNSLDHNGN
ncbi:uncharacterized protein PITG_11004 [Phytophthora infestans T30-4]|uniref:Transmembrane protein n=1 Tax=Phytophthora infestans (strain T30-4) TaxID=403677 RepID=D0NFY3_PHYIT|nr:uncharacterized protein PITG_11004 [Phytophthora infestans T30-4]EEY57184.1 conserved hypothetical protein [Phytophthora infestans T30-4]|eukprot:XP_002901794.1 conserved hypothetical protein [Phytophthora infestans T30-4]